MDFETYNRRRHWYEAGFFVALTVVNAVANSMTVQIDVERLALDVNPWEPWVWEVTSGVMWLSILPMVLLFNRHFPLERPSPRRNFLLHALFTLPVSLVHVVGMFGLRAVIYSWMGEDYGFNRWYSEFFYEYLKDFRSYAGLLVLIYLYRFILRRWQGEASLPDNNEGDAGPADRFLVKKLGKEFLVKTGDIEWLEASGNYVNLHVNGRVYPLRETMSAMERKLMGQGFARVHRSAILNLDRVAEIEPFDTGDAQARLDTGALVPVSRRHRAELRDRLV